jgi:hypothetical protein
MNYARLIKLYEKKNNVQDQKPDVGQWKVNLLVSVKGLIVHYLNLDEIYEFGCVSKGMGKYLTIDVETVKREMKMFSEIFVDEKQWEINIDPMWYKKMSLFHKNYYERLERGDDVNYIQAYVAFYYNYNDIDVCTNNPTYEQYIPSVFYNTYFYSKFEEVCNISKFMYDNDYYELPCIFFIDIGFKKTLTLTEDQFLLNTRNIGNNLNKVYSNDYRQSIMEIMHGCITKFYQDYPLFVRAPSSGVKYEDNRNDKIYYTFKYKNFNFKEIKDYEKNWKEFDDDDEWIYDHHDVGGSYECVTEYFNNKLSQWKLIENDIIYEEQIISEINVFFVNQTEGTSNSDAIDILTEECGDYIDEISENYEISYYKKMYNTKTFDKYKAPSKPKTYYRFYNYCHVLLPYGYI